MSILDELHKVFRELPPPPRWNGEVRKDFVLLPYQGAAPCDMCGGDGLTSDGLDRCYKCDGAKTQPGPMVHAVLVDRTLFVSKEAWEALATYPDVILGKMPRAATPIPTTNQPSGEGGRWRRMNDKALDEAIAALSGQLALANAVRDVLPFMRDAADTGCSERFEGRVCICLRCRARDWLREHEFAAASLPPHPARGDDGGGE